MADGTSTDSVPAVPAVLAGSDAVIFDLDGVVTDTASVHAAAWKAVFDDLLRARAATESTLFNPFDADRDYRRHVDGKDRYDGVAAFLSSRAIRLPWGSPDDPPEAETVCGVGNRKNGAFLRRLEQDGAEPFPSTIALLRALRDAGVPRALFSASRNAVPVLRAAGAEDLFDAIVDGRGSASSWAWTARATPTRCATREPISWSPTSRSSRPWRPSDERARAHRARGAGPSRCRIEPGRLDARLRRLRPGGRGSA